MVQYYSSGSHDQYDRAVQVWHELTTAARNKQILTYDDLAARMGLGGPQAPSAFVVLVSQFCSKLDLPNLTVLVLSHDLTKLGDIFQDPLELWNEITRVFRYNWSDVVPLSREDFRQVIEAD